MPGMVLIRKISQREGVITNNIILCTSNVIKVCLSLNGNFHIFLEGHKLHIHITAIRVSDLTILHILPSCLTFSYFRKSMASKYSNPI